MNLNKNELFDIVDELENRLGTDEFLLNILLQMNIDELEETLRFIDRMFDTNLFE